MVGADPRAGNSTTTVKTVIVPLKLNFVAAGQDTSAIDALYYPGFHATPLTQSFDGTRRVADVLNSPIFRSFTYPADMGGDTAQYGDAFMRAQFAKIGSGYHVSLENVKTYPTQTIDVPASKGVAYNRAAAESAGKEAIAGIADDKWFSAHLQNLLNSLHIDATTVPIFLTDNVMLYSGTYDNCCTIGYHGAGMPIGHGAGSADGKGNNPVQTFIYAAWSKPGTYSGFYSDYSGNRSYPTLTRGIADIHALSHEVAGSGGVASRPRASTPGQPPDVHGLAHDWYRRSLHRFRLVRTGLLVAHADRNAKARLRPGLRVRSQARRTRVTPSRTVS